MVSQIRNMPDAILIMETVKKSVNRFQTKWSPENRQLQPNFSVGDRKAMLSRLITLFDRTAEFIQAKIEKEVVEN